MGGREDQKENAKANAAGYANSNNMVVLIDVCSINKTYKMIFFSVSAIGCWIAFVFLAALASFMQRLPLRSGSGCG